MYTCRSSYIVGNLSSHWSSAKGTGSRSSVHSMSEVNVCVCVCVCVCVFLCVCHSLRPPPLSTISHYMFRVPFIQLLLGMMENGYFAKGDHL